MKKKIFNPENYGMILCSCCNGVGYIQNPERQCCPKCGGFGFVKMEAQQDINHFSIIGKEKGTSRLKEGDIFESLLDGSEYIVKSIVNSMVVLQSRSGTRQILTGVETLRLKCFYREKEKKANQ